MKIYMLEYVYHIYRIDLIEKRTEIRTRFFAKIEELIAEYKERKNSLFMDLLPACTDFKLYTAELKEDNLNMIDKLL